jgi:hypothetical protein
MYLFDNKNLKKLTKLEIVKYSAFNALGKEYFVTSKSAYGIIFDFL